MLNKTLVSLASIGLLFSLAACGGSPKDDMSPSVSSPADEPSTTGGTSAAPSLETSGAAATPDDSMGPASDPAQSEDSAMTDEIPSVIHGKWITVGEGEKARECTEELEGEGAIITIDATRISSFAFLFELKSIEESSADSVEGVFTYQDDSDALITPTIRLGTRDDWQTLEFTELGTEGQAPAIYARCS